MSNRRKLKVISRAPAEFSAERGTPLYAYNYFRSNVMTALLNDLIELENQGLDEEHCKVVRQSLGHFVNATTEIPRGGFLTGALSSEVEEFEELYKKWNDVQGRDPGAVEERRKLLKRLRRARQNITDRIRDLQVEIFLGLDRAILVATYRALADLIQAAPAIFRNLGQALVEYNKRGPLTA